MSADLVPARGVARPVTAPDDRDAVLHEITRAAQSAYPAIAVPAEAFIDYLRERLPAGVPRQVALREIHTADLYVACACARGDPEGLAAFDGCLHQLDGALRRLGIAADPIAEIKQDIRSWALVGDGLRPKILEFSGRGDLRAWLRVIAVRQALRRQQRARREVAMEDAELLDRIATGGSPELEHAKQVYRQAFREAFEHALHALSDRERTMLRQHYIDALSVDELGALYRTHRSTAARMIARARLQVLAQVRARMMAQLDVPSGELDSILRMIRSQIDISLRVIRAPQS